MGAQQLQTGMDDGKEGTKRTSKDENPLVGERENFRPKIGRLSSVKSSQKPAEHGIRELSSSPYPGGVHTDRVVKLDFLVYSVENDFLRPCASFAVFDPLFRNRRQTGAAQRRDWT